MAGVTYDLISAKVEAAKLSRTQNKTVYILLITQGKDDGDFVLSYAAWVPKHETVHAYRNGSEIPLDEEKITEPTKEVKTKMNKVMPTKKAKPAKKAAKKEVVNYGKGEKKTLTVKAIVALLEKNVRVTTLGGTPHILSYAKDVKDQSKEREVLVFKAQ